MKDEINLSITSREAGQILDALRERLNIWKYTLKYISTGIVEEPYCVEECSNKKEAAGIVNYYEHIICKIERQFPPMQNTA